MKRALSSAVATATLFATSIAHAGDIVPVRPLGTDLPMAMPLAVAAVAVIAGVAVARKKR